MDSIPCLQDVGLFPPHTSVDSCMHHFWGVPLPFCCQVKSCHNDADGECKDYITQVFHLTYLVGCIPLLEQYEDGLKYYAKIVKVIDDHKDKLCWPSFSHQVSLQQGDAFPSFPVAGFLGAGFAMEDRLTKNDDFSTHSQPPLLTCFNSF